MTLLRTVGFTCLLSLGCGGKYDDDQCKDILDQIVLALQDNVSKGVLLPTAVPCGPDGVANKATSFDPRVPAQDVEYLQGAFRKACAEYLDNC